jgi:hypothetical protein
MMDENRWLGTRRETVLIVAFEPPAQPRIAARPTMRGSIVSSSLANELAVASGLTAGKTDGAFRSLLPAGVAPIESGGNTFTSSPATIWAPLMLRTLTTKPGKKLVALAGSAGKPDRVKLDLTRMALSKIVRLGLSAQRFY